VHLTDGTIFDVHSRRVDQDIDLSPSLADLIDKVLDAGSVSHIQRQADDLWVA
jgi:hypothetical protein